MTERLNEHKYTSKNEGEEAKYIYSMYYLPKFKEKKIFFFSLLKVRKRVECIRNAFEK